MFVHNYRLRNKGFYICGDIFVVATLKYLNYKKLIGIYYYKD
jgi:hypothetical protein